MRTIFLYLVAGLATPALAASDTCGSRLEAEASAYVIFLEDFNSVATKIDLRKIEACVERNHHNAYRLPGEPALFALICPGRHNAQRFLVRFSVQPIDESDDTEASVESVDPIDRKAELHYWETYAIGVKPFVVTAPTGGAYLIGGKTYAEIWIEAALMYEVTLIHRMTIPDVEALVAHLRFPVKSGDAYYTETILWRGRAYKIGLRRRDGIFHLARVDETARAWEHRTQLRRSRMRGHLGSFK